MHRQLSLRSRAANAERCLETLLAGKAQKELDAQQAEVFFSETKIFLGRCLETLLAGLVQEELDAQQTDVFFSQNISRKKNCTKPFSQEDTRTC
jgi:hypothetical protein